MPGARPQRLIEVTRLTETHPDTAADTHRRLRQRVLISVGVLLCLLLALPLAALIAVDSGLANGPIQMLASQTLHRAVTFKTIRTRLMSSRPTVRIDGLVVGAPSWAGRAPLLTVRSAEVQLRAAPLWVGRVEPVALFANGIDLNLVSLGRGRESWVFGGGPSPLHDIKTMNLANGHFRLNDVARQVVLSGTFQEREPSQPARAFVLQAQGSIKGGAVSLTWNGAPLNGRPQGADWPMTARIVDGATVVDFDGASKGPFNFKNFRYSVKARGPNLADLHYLFGLASLNSRQYDLAADLQRSGPKLILTRIHGRVGASTVTGAVNLTGMGQQPRLVLSLSADAISKTDADLLATGVPNHTVARVAASKPAARTSEDRPFSDQPFDLTRLRRANIDAHLRVGQLIGYKIGSRNLEARVHIGSGLLSIDPITFDLEPGRGKLVLHLDMRAERPAAVVTMSLIGARLAMLKPSAMPLDGVLNIWLSLRGAGRSPAAMAASLGGKAAFNVGAGHLPSLQAAVLGGDVVDAFGGVVSKSAATAPLHCMVGEFDGANGLFSVRELILAIGSGAATGSGVVDLRSQTYRLMFHSLPQGAGLFKIDLPVSLTGPINHPKAKLALEGVTPLAAIKVVAGGAVAALKSLVGAKPAPTAVNCPLQLGRSAQFASVRP